MTSLEVSSKRMRNAPNFSNTSHMNDTQKSRTNAFSLLSSGGRTARLPNRKEFETYETKSAFKIGSIEGSIFEKKLERTDSEKQIRTDSLMRVPKHK